MRPAAAPAHSDPGPAPQVKANEPRTLSYELCQGDTEPLKLLVYERCAPATASVGGELGFERKAWVPARRAAVSGCARGGQRTVGLDPLQPLSPHPPCSYVDKAAYEEVHKTSAAMAAFKEATSGIKATVTGARAQEAAALRVLLRTARASACPRGGGCLRALKSSRTLPHQTRVRTSQPPNRHLLL